MMLIIINIIGKLIRLLAIELNISEEMFCSVDVVVESLHCKANKLANFILILLLLLAHLYHVLVAKHTHQLMPIVMGHYI